jgi:protein SCO1/2
MFKFLVTACLVICLAACSNKESAKKFNGLKINAAEYADDFELIDHHGQLRHLADYQNKFVLIFFGYTHCPDICPSSLMDMATLMRLLGDDKDKVQVLFITLDPARDTQAVLAKFIPSFDASFIGLYGTETQINQTAKGFKVFFEQQASNGLSAYTIDHSAGSYLIDQSGKLRLYYRYGQKPDEIANDIKNLM